MPQQSANVATNDVVRAVDHNTSVADHADYFAFKGTKGVASGLASLTAVSRLAQSPQDGGITTLHLAANAATQLAYAETTSAITTASLSYVDASASLSATLTTTGGDVLVFVFSKASQPTIGYPAQVAIGLDGGTDYEVGYMGAQGGLIAVPISTMYVKRFTGLSAGSHTFKTRIKSSGSGGAQSFPYSVALATGLTTALAYIMAIELKR